VSPIYPLLCKEGKGEVEGKRKINGSEKNVIFQFKLLRKGYGSEIIADVLISVNYIIFDRHKICGIIQNYQHPTHGT
jgi:hypothetical protein